MRGIYLLSSKGGQNGKVQNRRETRVSDTGAGQDLKIEAASVNSVESTVVATRISRARAEIRRIARALDQRVIQ